MSLVDWIKIFKDFSSSEKEQLSMFCQEKFLKKWVKLFEDNWEATAMYLLKKWSIEISKNIDWKKVVLWAVNAEEVLWEMALFWKTNKRMATATALVDSSLIVMLSFSIKELIWKYPELLEKIKKIISEREVVNKKII